MDGKDEVDSLAGAVYSASKFLKVGDLSTLDNYSAFMDANENQDKSIIGTSVANKLFDEFNIKNDKTETEIQNEKIDNEIKVLKQLRENLDEEDKGVTDKQLLDLYNSSFENDDMILF